MNLSFESKLSLHEITIRPDHKHFIVEDVSSGDFYEMPKICIDAINYIENGKSLGEIEAMLKQDYPPDEVDVIGFAEQLIEFGLVKLIDETPVDTPIKQNPTKGFEWISPQIAKIFFNKYTNKLYPSLLFLNIGLLIFNSDYIPHYRDLFLFDSMMISILIYMGISLLLIIIHEFGHILAIRAQHLPAKLDIGNRLFLIVFETDLTASWKLPQKKRNILFFGGIAFEQVILFIAILLLLTGVSNSLFSGIITIIIFDIIIKTIYQCCFYMKTDFYYLIENITGHYNLMENGKQFLSKWIPFLKKNESTVAFDGEMRGIRLYSVFYLLGIVLTFVLFGVYLIPALLFAYSKAITYISSSPTNPYFWDGVFFLGQTVLLLGLLIYVKAKK
ncbi:peptidase [Ornithinibacillus halotolerans]|uniref:Peptidase n=1 Tax=Ornithinibacillus halotolerans TaxID=1274357 RepID=A0A916W4P9_9BACI|nr:peptidase [Ornithinibacillus halotolerans]GGA65477.1 hypothetical protein GCM10008025_06620 [Ornithinibacillus halotolerans]